MENIIFNAALQLPVFLFAIVAHEWGHARMAKFYGDDTAERSGRLTLNPMSHIDLFGTVLFPGFLILMGLAPFGWAKPVPVAVRNLRDPKNGIFWVSFAGPGMNIILGTLSSIILSFVFIFSQGADQAAMNDILLVVKVLKFSIIINFVLAFFNLIPLGPLDGAKMVPRFLSYNLQQKWFEFNQYGSQILMGLILLSYLGFPIFNILLYPGYWLADFLPRLFVGMMV